MKIAVLTYSLNGIGGIAKHVLHQCREMAKMGHEVDVWAVEYDAERCYPELVEGFEVQALRKPEPQSGDIYDVGTGMRMVVYLKELWRYYQEQQELAAAIPPGYDVINPHGNTINWAAATYKKKHGTPVVWMCNDFWPVASHAYTNPQGLGEKVKHALKSTMSVPADLYDRAAVRAMDDVVVLSERVQSQMHEHYDVDPIIIRTGIDAKVYANGDGSSISSRYSDLAGREFVLLTVAMLMPRRKIEDVIQSVKMLIDDGLDMSYLLVGRTTHTPSYTQFLKDEVIRLGLDDRVHFTGEVTEQELIDSFQVCDAFIWPADENQSWGMACLEAMAAGKPVLVSHLNGLAEVLDDGHNALIVDTQSSEQIVTAIKKLVADPNARQSIASNGQQLVQDKYSWRSNAEAMLERFQKAIDKYRNLETSG
jgi:glycosyltransferase involved in cell wall biosynthesis